MPASRPWILPPARGALRRQTLSAGAMGTALHNPTPDADTPSFRGFTSHGRRQQHRPCEHQQLHPRRPLAHAFNGPGAGQTSAATGAAGLLLRQLSATRAAVNLTQPAWTRQPPLHLDPGPVRAWTRTTTPATWRTGSWRSRAPTARSSSPRSTGRGSSGTTANNNVDDWQRLNQSNPNRRPALGRLGGADPPPVARPTATTRPRSPT